MTDPAAGRRMACFRCDACATEEVRFNDRGMIDEPTKCSNANCAEKFTMKLVHNRCHFFDKQIIKMQARLRPLLRHVCKGLYATSARA